MLFVAAVGGSGVEFLGEYGGGTAGVVQQPSWVSCRVSACISLMWFVF
jgi:hypothetical protein